MRSTSNSLNQAWFKTGAMIKLIGQVDVNCGLKNEIKIN